MKRQGPTRPGRARGGRGGPPKAAPAGPGPTANAGARGALLLAVAVILGVVLLQKFDTGIDAGAVSASSGPQSTTSTTRRVTLTTVGAVSTTTTNRARAKADVKVVVANGARVSGLAGTATTTLKNGGYAPLSPVDATAAVDKTTIQYAEGYEAEAREVATTLGQPATVVAKLSPSPPVAAADIGEAKVVVILGADAATTTTSSPATGAGSTTSTTKR